MGDHQGSHISGAKGWQPLFPSAPRSLRRRSGRQAGWREASPAGTGSARVTGRQGDTAAQARGASTLRFRCLSIRSRAPAASHTRPRRSLAPASESRPKRRSAWAFLPERSQVRGLVRPRPILSPPPPPPKMPPTAAGPPFPELYGEPDNAGAAASLGPFPGGPGGPAPRGHFHFRRPAPYPSLGGWALKARGWAGPQAEAPRALEARLGAARAPGPAPGPSSLPPSPPRPALPAHPSPPRTPAPRPPPTPPRLARAAEQ